LFTFFKDPVLNFVEEGFIGRIGESGFGNPKILTNLRVPRATCCNGIISTKDDCAVQYAPLFPGSTALHNLTEFPSTQICSPSLFNNLYLTYQIWTVAVAEEATRRLEGAMKALRG
jgi:hypothetical protein